jgi:hypothetical protein
MKPFTLLCFAGFLAGTLAAAADSSPKDDVLAAAKQLGDKVNYGWKTTVVVPEDAQFKPGPTEGKTEKGGLTHFSMSFFDNPFDVFLKGDQAAFTDRDGAWQSLAEAEAGDGQGPGRFMGQMVRNLRTPAAEAGELAEATKDLKRDGEAYSGELTDAGAKKFLSFRRDANDPNVSNAKGSVKFWIRDGVLAKYEFKVKGTVSFNNNDYDNDRTTTVEIKDVGATKVEIPDGAKRKLS